MTKHVGDLKLAGPRHVIVEVMKVRQETVGELKTTCNDFTNCGVRHQQNPVTKEITLDQSHFVTTLKPIVHQHLATEPPGDNACAELHELYRSLLGAVAYLSHTRLDVNVFVSALQRHGHQPLVQHVKKLNKLLTWLQEHPRKLHYRQFPQQ